MVLGFNSIDVIRTKTHGKCSCCGKEHEYLDYTCFFPMWTRVEKSIDNYIPICPKCLAQRGLEFLELSKVPYLTKEALYALMLFYVDNSKYLKYYTKRFGKYRTNGIIDIDRALTVLGTYDVWVDNNSKELFDYEWRIRDYESE